MARRSVCPAVALALWAGIALAGCSPGDEAAEPQSAVTHGHPALHLFIMQEECDDGEGLCEPAFTIAETHYEVSCPDEQPDVTGPLFAIASEHGGRIPVFAEARRAPGSDPKRTLVVRFTQGDCEPNGWGLARGTAVR